MGTDLEASRQAIVEKLEPDELSRHPVFDDVSEAMAMIAGTEEAYVTLMEDDTQCMVGFIGNYEERLDRELTFCTHTLAAQEVTVVEDAREEPRLRDLPMVAETDGVVFYVGVPLSVDGVPVGTLCATGPEPKSVTDAQKAEMLDLARHVERFLAVFYRHPVDSIERDLVGALCRAAADVIFARWNDIPSAVDRKMVGVESELDVLYDRLAELVDLPKVYEFSKFEG